MEAALVGDGAATIRAVSTDTRADIQESLFFALKGEHADGHRYVPQAFALGARAAVVEQPIPDAAGAQIVVPDTLTALGRFAAFYRRQFTLPLVGITGSVGKTSTKELVAHVLRAHYQVLANALNYNNEIGVPKTVFQLDDLHTAAVLEMGMRGLGQIAELAAIARPNFGVITNIGLSHIELLGTQENIARAKGELFAALPPDGVAFLLAEEPYAPFLRSLAPCRVVTFGTAADADFRVTDARFLADGTSRFAVNGQPMIMRVPGVHHLLNAAAAAAVAAELRIPLDLVAEQVASFTAPAMRMERRELAQGITLLDDAYNAAPDSMRSALTTLARLSEGRRTVAILGDMRELGDHSAAAHRAVGERVGEEGIAVLVVVGETASRDLAAGAEAALPAQDIHRFPTTEAAAAAVPSLLQPNDLVLVKGSRAMEMEKITARLTDQDCHE